MTPRSTRHRAGRAEPVLAARRRTILELVTRREIGSQAELAALLRDRGFAVTQATVSRDIAELGLVKASRGNHHAYVTPGALAAQAGGRGRAAGPAEGPGAVSGDPDEGTARLRRILAEYPVTVGRSGLTLVLVGRPGAAAAIAQAIDESDLDDQVGTLAGDNTVLVLFPDEPALERWRARFHAIAARADASPRAATSGSAAPAGADDRPAADPAAPRPSTPSP